jgi:NAD+ synthase (glutamine-hydrolysing)
MNYGFVRIATATPQIRVADCEHNGNVIIEQIKEAYGNSASLIVFPELCITGYTCGDLFLQSTLLKSAENTLARIAEATADLDIVAVVGLPVPYNNNLYNCGAVICKGELLALVPKINIPNYTEFYEARHFTSGKNLQSYLVSFAGFQEVFLGSAVFKSENNPDFTFGVEVCEDLWVANSPSTVLALNGSANIILNLSTSDDVIGKAEYRRNLVKIQSGKLICAYAFASSGFGESTTDMVFSGQNIISENATILAESQRFKTGITYGDVDLQRLAFERRRTTTFVPDDTLDDSFDEIFFDIEDKTFELNRTFPQTPFVPANAEDIKSRCEEILHIQSTGLATRLAHTGIKNVVIGISGGLDSTLALIVCVHTYDMLGLDRKNIHAVTMPCFGTTKRTKSNAEKICEAYGVSLDTVDITKAVNQHFQDIDHDSSIHNITYENCQARERTQVLMDMANKYNGLVIGTGDLSELALGWATYNGDHMSMYGVNCSVPKTLVRYLTAYEADNTTGKLSTALKDILDTPVSPELLPPTEDGKISQKTEDVVGPYELHDFFLYYLVRFGYSPKKIYYLANISFKEKYTPETIKKWLTVFVKRFFAQQFKRSCLPDGPKVGSVTLSPRGDWRMPSDASSKLWLSQLEEL